MEFFSLSFLVHTHKPFFGGICAPVYTSRCPTNFAHLLQETIIVGEYMRALRLKSDGKKDEALLLFKELLDAEAVVKVGRRRKWRVSIN